MANHVNKLFSSVTYRINKILIDPGDVWEGFESVRTVLLTHAHFDHIYGLNELCLRNSDVKVYTNAYGRMMLQDAKKNMSYYHETPFVFEHPERIVVVYDEEEIELWEDIVAKAIFTPGHNPSCITWLIDDALFTGDSFIPGIKTVTNLPGGNRMRAIESENLIKQLAVGRRIYPGHKI